jgi:hypothetical protein
MAFKENNGGTIWEQSIPDVYQARDFKQHFLPYIGIAGKS